MLIIEYFLRPATDGDYSFFYNLNKITMKEIVEKVWGWDEVFQKVYFKEHFKTAGTYMIVVDNNDIGKLQYEKIPQSIKLIEIQILPTYQKKGIGTAILHSLIDEANVDSKNVTLQVLKASADAKRLYEHNGFVIYSETETHYLMRH